MRTSVMILALGLAGLLVCTAPGRIHAEEGEEAFELTAARVIQTIEAADSAALRALAAAIVPDRWLVADALCLRGRHDAARAFAQAVPAPEGPALLAYLEARGTTPVHAASRAALTAAANAADAAQVAAAVEALEALLYDGDPYEQARVRLALGEAQERSGALAQARVTLEGAGQAADRLGWIQGAASAWSSAGFVAWSQYDADATRRAWEHQFGAESRRDSLDGCALALNNLGGMCVELGDFPGAKARFTHGHQLLARLPAGALSGLRLALLTNAATMAMRAGRFADAVDSIDVALAQYGDLVPKAELAGALAVKSAIVENLGDAEDALRILEQAEGIYATVHDEALTTDPQAVPGARLDLARARAARGSLLVQMGRAPQGLPLLEAARTTYADLETADDEQRVLGNLGLALRAVGRDAAAVQAFEEAVAQADATGDRYSQVNTLQNLAETRRGQGDAAAARTLQTRALALAEAIAAPQLLADGHGGLGRVLLESGEPRRALLHAERGADALLQALAGLATPRGPQARERSAALFEVGIEAALRLGDATAATRLAERGRAATLLLALRGREEVRDAIVQPKLLAEEREAERLVAQARSLADRVEADARAGALARSPEGAREHVRRFRSELDKALTRQGEATGAVLRASRRAATLLHGAVDDLATIRARLKPGDVFVSFAFTRTGLAAVVLHADGEEAIDLGSQADLAAALDGLDWSDRAEPIPEERLAALRARLLTPLKLPEGTRRLLIAPAGPLTVLPFAALLPEGLQVAFVPSGTTYGLLQTDARQRGEGVLGVGGADYAGRPRLPRLPGSEAEIAAVATESLLGAAATETALRARLAGPHRWRALHLACHGTTDPTHPLRSALALTRGAQSGDDGTLTALEVLRMKVPADLTVLSACVTGQGRYFRGEGLVGLPRAFFVAGSPRVIASLWRVDDRATAALMERFYALWRPQDATQEALSTGEALRRAQADIRRRPGWEHPYYWAAWVLWGVPD